MTTTLLLCAVCDLPVEVATDEVPLLTRLEAALGQPVVVICRDCARLL